MVGVYGAAAPRPEVQKISSRDTVHPRGSFTTTNSRRMAAFLARMNPLARKRKRRRWLNSVLSKRIPTPKRMKRSGSQDATSQNRSPANRKAAAILEWCKGEKASKAVARRTRSRAGNSGRPNTSMEGLSPMVFQEWCKEVGVKLNPKVSNLLSAVPRGWR